MAGDRNKQEVDADGAACVSAVVCFQLQRVSGAGLDPRHRLAKCGRLEKQCHSAAYVTAIQVCDRSTCHTIVRQCAFEVDSTQVCDYGVDDA